MSIDNKFKSHFAQSHTAKMILAHKKRYFINPSFRENLTVLIKLLNSDYSWESPIVFMIPRDPDLVTGIDSRLYSVGGFSTQVQCWWHLKWSDEFQSRSINKMKKDSIWDWYPC
eukprot:8100910-Ditylum_brightwellii.AAC.1